MAENKTFALEFDTIEAGGEEAIKKTCKKGNTVYVDLQRIEEDSKKDRYRYATQLKKTLKYINDNSEFIGDNQYQMSSGGILTWKKPQGEIIHLTRDETIKSKLRREGKIEGKDYQNPKFLHYGTQTLKEGLLNIEFPADPKTLTLDMATDILERELYHNQYLQVNGIEDFVYRVDFGLETLNPEKTRFRNTENGKLLKIDMVNISPNFSKCKLYGLEQKLAFKNLTSKDVEISIISGGSGSGKTVIPYMAALQQLIGNEKQRQEGSIYDGIKLFKSNDLIGGSDRDSGFLPGTLFEKTKDFMESYEDAHRLLGFNSYMSFMELLADPEIEDKDFGKRKKSSFGDGYLPSREPAIKILHLQYSRGRTFNNSIIFMDEAQNYTPFEMKHFLERVGDHSKVIIVGDPNQIDNPRLSEDFNGLVFASNTLFGGIHPRFSQNYLYKNRRSQLAEIIQKVNAPQD